MNIGDILRIKQFFRQGTNEALIVSFWEVEAMTGTAENEGQLAAWLHNDFAALVSDFFLSNTAFYTRTVVDNLTGGLAYGDYSEDIVGLKAGQPMPAFVAMDVKQNVSNRITRSGRKRLPFLSEENVNGQAIVLDPADATSIEVWFGFSASGTDPLDVSNQFFLSPTIVGRTETPIGSGNYELDLTKLNEVASAAIIGATSQNSRKP